MKRTEKQSGIPKRVSSESITDTSDTVNDDVILSKILKIGFISLFEQEKMKNFYKKRK